MDEYFLKLSNFGRSPKKENFCSDPTLPLMEFITMFDKGVEKKIFSKNFYDPDIKLKNYNQNLKNCQTMLDDIMPTFANIKELLVNSIVENKSPFEITDILEQIDICKNNIFQLNNGGNMMMNDTINLYINSPISMMYSKNLVKTTNNSKINKKSLTNNFYRNLIEEKSFETKLIKNHKIDKILNKHFSFEHILNLDINSSKNHLSNSSVHNQKSMLDLFKSKSELNITNLNQMSQELVKLAESINSKIQKSNQNKEFRNDHMKLNIMSDIKENFNINEIKILDNSLNRNDKDEMTKDSLNEQSKIDYQINKCDSWSLFDYEIVFSKGGHKNKPVLSSQKKIVKSNKKSCFKNILENDIFLVQNFLIDFNDNSESDDDDNQSSQSSISNDSDFESSSDDDDLNDELCFVLKPRHRSISEGSEDSFIVFNESNSSPTTEDYEKNEINNGAQTNARFVDNDEIKSFDELDHVFLPTECCHRNNLSSKKSKKRVNFSEPHVTETHSIVKWNFAYRASRKGPWEQFRRDRLRFQQRIERTNVIISPILQPEHREQIYFDRFLNEIIK